MINSTFVEVGTALILVVMVGALVIAPPHPRQKPEPPKDESPIVEFQAVPTVVALPMTRQQKVDELEKKLETAEEDLTEIAKIIERLKAEEQAKKLDRIEQRR